MLPDLVDRSEALVNAPWFARLGWDLGLGDDGDAPCSRALGPGRPQRPAFLHLKNRQEEPLSESEGEPASCGASVDDEVERGESCGRLLDTLAGHLSPEEYYRAPLAPGTGMYLDLARAQYEVAIALDREYVLARASLADVYAAQARLGEELEHYDAILRIDPQDTDALWGRGWARFQREEFSGAARDFKAALRQDPRDWETLWALGLVRVLSGRHAEVQDAIVRLQQLNPGRAELLREIAAAFRSRSPR